MLEDVVVTGSFACVGAGMYCKNSSPVLIDVTFFDNYAGSGGTGGGMCCEGGSPVLTGVRFLENLADWGTGGLRLTNNCAAELRNVTFTGNVGLNGYGGLHCRDSSPLVANCTFSGNWGPGCGGIALEGNSSPLITGCTLFENWGGACGVVCCDGEGSAVFERTIIAGSASGSAIFPDCSPVVLTCCDIYGNSGGDWTGCLAAQCGTNGNFSACPSFCNAAEGDFHLCDESPCAPCNHPDGYDCGLIGAWDVGCSCGPTPADPTTWGSIKAMYK